MKRTVVSTIAVLAVLALAVPALAITWGQPDGNVHPNVGTILLVDGAAVHETCSGTLIHPQVLLTAGHCSSLYEQMLASGSITLDNLKVSFSGNDAYNPATFLDVEGVQTHPDYWWGPNSDPHDVGVILLNEADTVGIPLATLPYEGMLDDLKADGKLNGRHGRAHFTAVGYGVLLDFPPPVFLPSGGVRSRAVSEYLALRPAWLVLSQNGAPGQGNGGTCYGDSGGPNFWTEPDGTEIIVGITSTGDAQCVATNTTYRVDIPQTLSFIADVIGDLP